MPKLKFLGATVATLALCALATPVAQAGEYESENNIYPTSFTGEQVTGTVTGEMLQRHVFRTHAGNTICTTAKFSGEIKAKSTSQTIKPEYKGCNFAFGGTVILNECDYVFTAGETIGGSPDLIKDTVHVVCPSGKAIELVSANCVLTIKGATPGNIGKAGEPNQNLGTVTVENETTATPFMAVLGIIDVEKIAYSTNGKCPNDGGVAGNFTDGSYKGLTTLKSSVRGITVT